MNPLDNQLHPDAKTRFNNLARALLDLVTTFRDSARSAGSGFSPKTFAQHRLTDADIAGDIQCRYEDRDGKQTGIAVAEAGGLRTGLIDSGYEKLEALAAAMARTQPFKSTASQAFLTDQLFDWVIRKRRGHDSAECVDVVLDALGKAVVEHRLLFPVSDLYVQSPLTLGSVRVSTFPESIFEDLESRRSEQCAQLAQSLRGDFQGVAVVEATVVAEPIRAQELACQQVDLAIGVLRFFTPSGVTSRLARWGHAPLRTDRVFITDPSGKFLSTSGAVLDRPIAMVLSDELRGILLDVGLSEVCDILARDSLTDFEKVLLSGMVTFGRAALSSDLREKMIWYCAGLESLLVRDSSEPILQNLGDRLALFTYDKVETRSAVVRDIKAAYALRSRFLHHGVQIADGDVVQRFARHGLSFFSRTAKAGSAFDSKHKFLDHIDRLKLSGGSQ